MQNKTQNFLKKALMRQKGQKFDLKAMKPKESTKYVPAFNNPHKILNEF